MDIIKEADELLKKHRIPKSEHQKDLNEKKNKLNRMIVEMDSTGAIGSEDGRRILRELIREREDVIKQMNQRVLKEAKEANERYYQSAKSVNSHIY